jgi:hypothetical protein
MHDFLNSYITVEQVASVVGISNRAASKKLTRLDSTFMKLGVNPAGTGRPIKLYEIQEALGLWGRTPDDIEAQKRYIFRKKKKGTRPGPKSKLTGDTEEKLKQRTLELYLSQSIIKNVLPSVQKSTEELWDIAGEIEGFESARELAWYFYQKRVMRNDGMYKGFYHSEKWELLHRKRFNVPSYNNEMPTNRWDYVSLFEDIGAIGNGYGAGDMWVIDATQFDAWCTINGGKPELFYYLTISDGITGYPMLVSPITSENIQEVGAAMLRCIARYGIPKYGVMLDNSRTFKSNAIQSLIEAFYEETQLDDFRGGWNWYKKLFPGKQGPVQFPLARIPRHSFKARLEQSFNRMNIQQALQLPQAYQGSRESRTTKYELGTVPEYQLKNAPEFITAWKSFEAWIYQDYVKRISNTLSLKSFEKITGKRATLQAAWEHYGGPERQGGSLPAINQPRAFYYIAPKETHHRVTARLGSCMVTHQNHAYNYQCIELNKNYYGDKITCIPNPTNHRAAFLFKEIWGKSTNKMPVLKDVEYIGEAWDGTIRSERDLDLIYDRKMNQKAQEKDINESYKIVKKKDGWDKVQIEGASEHAEFLKEKTKELRPVYSEPEETTTTTISESDIDSLINSLLQ